MKHGWILTLVKVPAWLTVNVCRLVLAITFIFSGIVKVIDPRGFEYKLIDYGKAFGLSHLLQYNIPLLLGIGVATFEFMMGVNTLFGISRKGTSRTLFLFLVAMTGLTYYLATNNPVADCGCFGDAIILTNWETFYKNLVLLVCAIVLCVGHHYVTRLISIHTHWMVSVYSFIFAVSVASYALIRLPMIDFRPFHIGADLGGEPEFKTTFILQKNGVKHEFSEKDYPYDDTTWVYVDTRTEQVGQNHDFEMVSLESGEDISQDVVTAKGYTFLLIIPNLKTADSSMMDALNNLYDYCGKYDYKMYALTDVEDVADKAMPNVPESTGDVSKEVKADSSNVVDSDKQDIATDSLQQKASSAIEHWRDMTGAEYPFYQTDELTLKTMVRSNPGLILLKDGIVVNKWSRSNIPTQEDLNAPLDKLSLAQMPVGKKGVKSKQNGFKLPYVDKTVSIDGLHNIVQAFKLLLMFMVPVLLLLILDRIWFTTKAFFTNMTRLFSKNNKLIHTTMRKKIVAGNWKMNKNLQEGVALATELKEILAAEKPNCEVIIGTPFIHLATVSELLKDSVIAVSAENCANKEKGAYTGEVSAEMVKSTGAEYVILGHSERREYYNETPEILKEKVDLALANGLKVIFCIGESLAQREANEQEAVCKAELAGSVFHLTAEQWKNVVIAYEPIWAIGTGKTATAEQAEEIHAYIRSCVAEVYGAEAADETSILYGGSCKASNAPELFAKPDIDGGLIGGASLKAPDFKGIIDAWK